LRDPPRNGDPRGTKPRRPARRGSGPQGQPVLCGATPTGRGAALAVARALRHELGRLTPRSAAADVLPAMRVLSVARTKTPAARREMKRPREPSDLRGSR